MNYFFNLFIGRRQKVVQANGYIDTGNTLKDISTGKPVIVAPPEIMYELLPKELHYILYDYTDEPKISDLSAGRHTSGSLSYDKQFIRPDAGI